MAVAAMQGQGQFGVRYRAQGRLNMRTKGIKPATFRWQDAASAPELQPTWLQATCRVIFARKNFFLMSGNDFVLTQYLRALLK